MLMFFPNTTSAPARGIALAGLIAAGLALESCEPAGAVSAAPAMVAERHDGFWWIQTGSQSAAIACFGPTIATEEGPQRPWSLVIHLPGGDEPLACRQGMVPLSATYPIFAEGGTYRVELRPCEGCTWGDVTGEEQLQANALGLF